MVYVLEAGDRRGDIHIQSVTFRRQCYGKGMGMFFRGKSRAVSVSQHFWYTAVLLLILFIADWGYVVVDTLVVHA